MRVLKIILFVVIGLLALFLIVGAFIPTEVKTSQSTLIKAPTQLIFETINDLSTWESWSPWKEMDPNMKVTLADQTKGAGASYTWVGEKTGSGTMRIAESKPPHDIGTTIEFDGMGTADAGFILNPTEEGTEVTWTFSTEIPYPFNTFTYFQNMKGHLDKDFSRGLELLKEKMEAEAAAIRTTNSFKIGEKDYPARHFIGMKTTLPIPEMESYFSKNLPLIKEKMEAAGITADGPSYGLYYTYDFEKNESEFAIGYAAEEGQTVEGLENITTTPRKILFINYRGGYSGSMEAYNKFDEYKQENGLEDAPPVIEEYRVGPLQTADSTQWITNIYYGVQ